MYPGDPWSCDPNPFPQSPAAAQRPVSQRPARPCGSCGAPQVPAARNSIWRDAVNVHPREGKKATGHSHLRMCAASRNLCRGKGFVLHLFVLCFKDSLKKNTQLETGECTFMAPFFLHFFLLNKKKRTLKRSQMGLALNSKVWHCFWISNREVIQVNRNNWKIRAKFSFTVNSPHSKSCRIVSGSYKSALEFVARQKYMKFIFDF